MNNVVLGINGWFERTHDASAALLIDGQVVAMAEEERFIRIKHAYGRLPFNAVAFCLKQAGITLDQVDRVAVGWDYRKLYDLAGIREPKLKDLAEVYFPKKYFHYKKKLKIELISHHLAHAASSFYLSGFSEASIITLDGQGEDSSGSIAYGNDGQIKVLSRFPIKESLGYFYEAMAQFAGFNFDDPGKLMGLASYGKPVYEFDEINLTKDGYRMNIIPRGSSGLDSSGKISKTWLRVFTKFGPKNVPVAGKLDFSAKYKNLAASAQKTLEDVALHLVKLTVNKTGSQNLCLAGGVALNCSMNGKILRSSLVKDIFTPPFANDAGVSIGAALLVSDKKPRKRLSHAYLGPEFSNSVIEKELRKYGATYKKVTDIEKRVAELIACKKIVSWFQGRMEVGPRALGNRSILGNPGLAETHFKLNVAKGREQWRPLAPSILAENMDQYLEQSSLSPFMLLSFKVRKEYRRQLPALLHVDHSTRPQSVDKNVNRRYWRLIEKFGKLTGHEVIMNTSFNGKGEPIVSSPYDALSSFYSNTADCLAIGDFLVEK